MSIFFQDRYRVRLFRRVVSACLLAIFVVGMMGVPLRPIKQVQTHERFPCENCPCGCISADFCWDKCCCHSDEEKLAWAHENSVAAPDFLIQRVAQNRDCVTPAAASQTTSRSKSQASKCCCAAKNATCKTQSLVSQDDCTKENMNAPRVVLLKAVAECRGIDWMWNLLSQAIIVGHRRSGSGEPTLLFRTSVANDSLVSMHHTPDPPVP